MVSSSCSSLVCMDTHQHHGVITLQLSGLYGYSPTPWCHHPAALWFVGILTNTMVSSPCSSLVCTDGIFPFWSIVILLSPSIVTVVCKEIYYVLVSVSLWKRTWYRQHDKVDFITLLLITFHCLIETMLDHVTVVFSYATAVVLNLKTQSVNMYI